MATFLDVTGLAHFTSVFVFLFAWLVVYATLLWTKVLGDNKFISAIVSMLLGIFVLLSNIATSVVASVAPFMVIVFIFLFLINVTAGLLAGETGDVGASTAIGAVFLVFIIIVIVANAAAKIRSQADISETQTDLSKTINLVFHPTFLGTVLILAVAVFTIALLASRHA